MPDIPTWWMKGDWFDVCSCNVPCPCGFAQAPTNNHCDGVMAYHIREGAYGNVRVDGLSVIAVLTFDGNVWAGEGKASLGMFMDERADDAQREALHQVFSGQAGGWMGVFTEVVGEVRGVEFVPIAFAVADDLAHWSAEIPEKLKAQGEALTADWPLPLEYWSAYSRVILGESPYADPGCTPRAMPISLRCWAPSSSCACSTSRRRANSAQGPIWGRCAR